MLDALVKIQHHVPAFCMSPRFVMFWAFNWVLSQPQVSLWFRTCCLIRPLERSDIVIQDGDLSIDA
jgi:hypothetical protein